MKTNNLFDEWIKRAIQEDRTSYDVTSEWLFDDEHQSSAKLIAKESGVLSGLDIFVRTFELLDETFQIEGSFQNGDEVKKGDIIATMSGQTKAMLLAERTALNFIQRMSGIATETRKYVQAIADLPCKVVDTRKTAPGLRLLDKRAVKDGGGTNHRFNLSDGILIKDNHIEAAGGITRAIEKVRQHKPHPLKIEIEVESIEGLKEALDAGADIIMLDNMSTEMMRQAVEINGHRAVLEASGNMNLTRLREVAETGVDIISVGGLTHTVKAMDLSLRFK